MHVYHLYLLLYFSFFLSVIQHPVIHQLRSAETSRKEGVTVVLLCTVLVRRSTVRYHGRTTVVPAGYSTHVRYCIRLRRKSRAKKTRSNPDRQHFHLPLHPPALRPTRTPPPLVPRVTIESPTSSTKHEACLEPSPRDRYLMICHN